VPGQPRCRPVRPSPAVSRRERAGRITVCVAVGCHLRAATKRQPGSLVRSVEAERRYW